MSQFGEKDKEILNRIQSDFPVTPRPFMAIAEDLGLTCLLYTSDAADE